MTAVTGHSDALVVLVEDDEDIRRLVRDLLVREGFSVGVADSAAALDQVLARKRPDLVILDLMLPGEDGLSICRRLRSRGGVPILMLTAKSDPVDRVVGLEMGADDYVTKPFDPRELLARIKSVLRRAGGAVTTVAGPRVRMGRRVLDLDKRVLVDADGSEETLAASEFDLLKLLAENPNRPLARHWLLETVGHRDMDVFDRAIDLRITRLRRKIEKDAAHPEAIRTVRGVGYMFVPPKD
jgi:two-component system phosphate regulon response regulator OmpR